MDEFLVKKSVIVLKRSLLENPSAITKFWWEYHSEATDFHTRKIPEAGPNCICWSAISIDAVYKMDESYHPSVILRECKYIKENQKRD